MITLKGAAKDAYSGMEGTYFHSFGPNHVNGKPHWLQVGGSKALWYSKENCDWNIGEIEDLGSEKAGIYSTSDDSVGPGPHEVTIWLYYDHECGRWIETTDLICVAPGMY